MSIDYVDVTVESTPAATSTIVEPTIAYLEVGATVGSLGLLSGDASVLVGPEGPKGDKGDPGAQGMQGIQGVPGPKGDPGDSGSGGNVFVQDAAPPDLPSGEKGFWVRTGMGVGQDKVGLYLIVGQ